MKQMKQKNQGIFFIILAGFFFALMTFFVRMSGDLPTMQKAFFRNLVAVAIAAVTVIKSGEGIVIREGCWPDLLMRSFCGTVGLICNFYAIDHMSLADANILNKLSPFFAVIMSYFLLKEKANRIEWAAVAVAFIGALFVVKPSFNVEFVYALVGLLGGFGAGTAYTYVRRLGKKGEPGAVIVLFFSLFSCIVTLPFMIGSYSPMSTMQLVYLLLAGAAAAGGQFSITAAYTKAPAREISVFDYTQVIFAAMLGFFFLDQWPDVWSLTGYVIIIGSAFFKWYYLNKIQTES